MWVAYIARESNNIGKSHLPSTNEWCASIFRLRYTSRFLPSARSLDYNWQPLLPVDIIPTTSRLLAADGHYSNPAAACIQHHSPLRAINHFFFWENFHEKSNWLAIVIIINCHQKTSYVKGVVRIFFAIRRIFYFIYLCFFFLLGVWVCVTYSIPLTVMMSALLDRWCFVVSVWRQPTEILFGSSPPGTDDYTHWSYQFF